MKSAVSKSYGKSLDALLGKASSKAVIIVLPGCPHCSSAIQYLIDKAVPFIAVPKSSFSKGTLDAMAKAVNHRTYPRVFIKGKFVGGNKELRAI